MAGRATVPSDHPSYVFGFGPAGDQVRREADVPILEWQGPGIHPAHAAGAIGAKLGAPDREVVCITGDGAAGFNIMEMQSAAREKLALTTVVFAEGSWTMEEPNELALYGKTAQTHDGSSVICLRTDHDANLAVPEDMVARFFEVYSGPIPVEQPA